MRQKMLLLLVGLVCALGIFVPAVSADCTVTGGTAPNEIYTCDGTDTDGVDVGTGEDTVYVVGTVLQTISSGGTQLTVIILPGAVLDTTAATIDAILLIGDGSIIVTGDVSGFAVGIALLGDGSISSTGNVSGVGTGIYMVGDGSISSVGSVNGRSLGIYMVGNGSISSVGSVSSGTFGIYLLGDGSISSAGNVSSGSFGIFLGNGSIISTGNVSGSDSYGIYLGSGSIISRGDVSGGDTGIFLGSGSIISVGDISGGGFGIFMVGDGSIRSDGSVTANSAGIQGLNGEQMVDVSGGISAPLAVSLGAGNDSLMIRSFTVVDGEIRMGDGDDVVVVENYAQVNGTIYGGEGAEVNGDLLVLGSGEFCSEAEALAAGLGIDTLDPNSGTTTYLGQTYTWEEFERLGREATVAPCIGKINDGRINAYDLGAPEALYCTVENGVSVWELDLDGNGTFSFAVSKAQIEAAFAAATGSGMNTLIGSDSFGNELYTLSDGATITFVSPELREAGKQYLFSFDRTLCG